MRQTDQTKMRQDVTSDSYEMSHEILIALSSYFIKNTHCIAAMATLSMITMALTVLSLQLWEFSDRLFLTSSSLNDKAR